ncbi:mechanosensitive ion channel domain-containing protein [Methylophaga thiooxydans]|uniref:Transporter, MscS family n=1 Tax=Methylophaga thiooxydans DMS010 TaxID=637616 RepID=C0N3V4_9GAMM|nr:mechanosensitive ion channel domain-containing protein [Methylophaga thiooxydans]EEF80550.1 transporter, MscS family [Methylophaga thiooxydans DMS010]
MSTTYFSDFKLFFAAIIVSVGMMVSISDSAAQTAPENEGNDHYQVLADMLADPASRDELIAELRQLSDKKQTTTNDSTNKQDAQPKDTNQDSVSTEVAKKSQSVVESIVTTLTGSWTAMSELASGQSKKIVAFFGLLIQLGLVVAATVGAYIILRVLARFLFKRADRLANADTNVHPLVVKATAIVLSVLTDVIVVAMAWLAGYGVALLFIGEVGKISVSQTLFLNIFIAVELFKVALRAIFSGREDSMRLLPMKAKTARYWNGFLAVIVSFVGYGVLFLAPLVGTNLSENLGDLFNLFIVLVTVAYALTIVIRQRLQVRESLAEVAKQSNFAATQVMLRVLSRSWHLFAMAYFVVMGVALLIKPDEALPELLMATLQTVLAVFIGMGIIALLEMTVGKGIRVPAVISYRLSTFETRLNNFLPTLNKVLKVLVTIMVISAIFDAWGAVDLPTWLASPAGTQILSTVISVLFILTVSMFLWMVLASWIEHRLNPEEGKGEPSAREKTLLTIFRNATAITIIVMTTMIVLSEIGINIGPLIAGAGVLGLAVGFGAQKLVQDVITGVFIQMENAINAGDIVTVSGLTGVAEKLTIRSLGLRDLSGTYHVVPFSAVDTVSNYMREFAYHVGEYGVAYRENTDEVIIKLREAFAELLADDEQRANILEDELEVHGVTALADSSVNIRVRIKTLPGSQWSVGRAYNRLVKQYLDAAGIEIPFPHLTLYFGEDKNGDAPAMPMRMINEVEVVNDAQKTAEKETNQKALKQPKKAESNPSNKGDFDDGE